LKINNLLPSLSLRMTLIEKLTNYCVNYQYFMKNRRSNRLSKPDGCSLFISIFFISHFIYHTKWLFLFVICYKYTELQLDNKIFFIFLTFFCKFNFFCNLLISLRKNKQIALEAKAQKQQNNVNQVANINCKSMKSIS